MKKIITLIITAASLLTLTSCGKDPVQPSEAAPAVTAAVADAAEVTDAALAPESESSESSQAVDLSAIPAWEGKWQADDTDEHFEIYDVTNDGFKMVFYHFKEGQIEEFNYVLEFDDPEKMTASEIGNDHSGWEYSFSFNGNSILVRSKHPDQTYNRVVE